MSTSGSSNVTFDPSTLPAILEQMNEISLALTAPATADPYEPFKLAQYSPGTAGANGNALAQQFVEKMIGITLALAQMEGPRDLSPQANQQTSAKISTAISELVVLKDGFGGQTGGIEMPAVTYTDSVEVVQKSPISIALPEAGKKVSVIDAAMRIMLRGVACGVVAGKPANDPYYNELSKSISEKYEVGEEILKALRGALSIPVGSSMVDTLRAAITAALYSVIQSMFMEMDGVTVEDKGYAALAASPAANGLDPSGVEAYLKSITAKLVSDASGTAFATAVKDLAEKASGKDNGAKMAGMYKRFVGDVVGAPDVQQYGGSIWGGADMKGTSIDHESAGAENGALNAAYKAAVDAYNTALAAAGTNKQFLLFGMALIDTALWDADQVKADPSDADNRAAFDALLSNRYNQYFAAYKLAATEQNNKMKYKDNLVAALDRYITNRINDRGDVRKKEMAKARTSLSNFREAFKIICEKPQLQRYFNLLKKDGNRYVPVTDMCSVNSDFDKYYLNVKKVNPTYSGGDYSLVGGAPNDIVWVEDIPPYSGPIMYNGTVHTSTTGSTTFLQDMIRQVYYNGGRNQTLTVQGVTINLRDVALRNRTSHVFVNQDFQGLVDYYTKVKMPEKAAAEAIAWKSKDYNISVDLWAARTRWNLEGDKMVYRDEKGDVKNVSSDSLCGLIKASGVECADLLRNCSQSGDCAALMDMEFETDIPMTEMTKIVMDIPPTQAFDILQHYKFGEFDAVADKVLPGLIRYEVQSVDSWLAALMSDTDRCTGAPVSSASSSSTGPTPPGCGSLSQQLGRAKTEKILKMAKDPSKKGFFTYLHILVNWVNANHILLNPQELSNRPAEFGEPPADSRFKMHNHYGSQFGMGRPNRSSITCGMMELLSNHEDENNISFRHNPIASIQAMKSLPDLNMPFSRSAFLGPIPNVHLNASGFVFGGSNALNYNITNSRAFGTKAYTKAIEELQRMLLGQRGPTAKFNSNSQAHIQSKLDIMRNANDQLSAASKDLAESVYYYKKFQGKLDTFSNLEDIKKKQYLLMDRSKQYNDSLSGVGEIITRLAAALEGVQLPQGRLDPNTYRPLTSAVHDIHMQKF